jgi:hypothetical protein
MRVLPLGLLLIISVGAFADEVVWRLDLYERARRRADPTENAARRAAWIANGRAGVPPLDVNVVEGSYDPTILAPIELMMQIYPVYNLEPARRERFRRDWTSRGATELLGEGWWERLRVVFSRAIALDHEIRRIHALPADEQKAIAAARDAEPPREGHDDDGECEAEAEALRAGREIWGETFDRFLYEVVAPGVYYWISSSDQASLTKPERWLEEWEYRERSCRR